MTEGSRRAIEAVDAALEAICLTFNEGFAATSCEDCTRPTLCEEALRPGRVLAGLMPHEQVVHGLVALVETGTSRLHARVGPNEEPVEETPGVSRAAPGQAEAAEPL